MLIDTHAHIDFDDYENIEAVIQRAKDNGVGKIIIPGVEAKCFDKIIKLIEKYDCLYGAVGIHPSEARSFNDEIESQIFDLAKHEKIVAVGETGLDYYWDKSFVDVQKEVFIKQIKIANELNKAIIVHNRDAHSDCIDILRQYKNASVNVIMHCFSGSPEFALECVKEGFYIALGGVVTFKNAKKPKEVAQIVPLEKLLLETDSPFLTPHPHRGECNEPAYIKLVAEEIAYLRNTNFAEIESATTDNALKAFNLQVADG